MHAHAAHEWQRADKNDVLPDLRADAAAVIAAVGVRAAATAELGLQEPVEQGGEGILRCRLLDMGLIPNTRVTVQKIAPMGDPMEIRLRSYELTLRMDDAAQIEILPEVGA